MKNNYESPEITVFKYNSDQAVLITSSGDGVNGFSKDEGWSLLNVENKN